MPSPSTESVYNGVYMDDSLSILNPNPKPLDGPSLLHFLIAGPQHDGVALEYTNADGKQIWFSYKKLHAEAERLASRIVQSWGSNVGHQYQIIPLYITQCPSLYISLLAILKTGAAFCPINLDIPEDRLKFILKDTQAGTLLTTSALRSSLPVLDDVNVIVVDEDDLKSEYGHISLPTSLPEDALAYVMYTSGSTGLPKAVCLPHLAVSQSLLAHDKHIPPFDRFLQFASPTFDVSVFEIFFPWMRGRTLISCERGRLLSDLPGTITALNVDAAELTPTVAASLVRSRNNVPTLKMLLTIGEMLNPQVIQEFAGSGLQSSILYGMYGPTEAAIHCTLQPSFGVDMPAGTIGVPLDTVSCFVVKPAESAELANTIEILPQGEIGELVVGGHQLASGYLNRDEQTRSVFVSHPTFGSLYRTGDKARLLPNGVLECHGRISSGQVKLRGQRIELGEIEHAASKVQGCHAVVASVISGQLIVFCVVEDSSVTTDDLQTACRKWLPKYMIPSDVVLLDDFPYLPSGKVDKRTLEGNYKSRVTASVVDHDSISAGLMNILQTLHRVLHVEVSVSTNLGTVGLDSLKAIQVASELRKGGITSISALDLLASSTARDLQSLLDASSSLPATNRELAQAMSQALDSIRQHTYDNLLVDYDRAQIQEILPCTPVQDAMLSETNQDPRAYCNSFELSLSYGMDMIEMRSHLIRLAESHPLLRSGFCLSGTSLSTYSQLTRQHIDESQIQAVEEFNLSFSIDDPATLLYPLMIQYKQDNGALRILFQLHHALYDQWSIEILIDDLNDSIHERRISDRPSFKAINEFYLELSLSRDSQEESLEFWSNYLSGVVPSHLPSLTGDKHLAGSLDVAHYEMNIDMSITRQAAHKMGVSTHVFFQAAFTYLLGMYMGSPDVTFGTVFSGRTLPIADIEHIFGPILSTLPTRVNMSDTRTFGDILRKLQGDNRDIMKHGTVSLSDIKRTSGAPPGEGLFDSIFVWQETARMPGRNPNTCRLLETRDYLEFGLTLELEPSQEGVRAKATYQSNLLAAAAVGTMLRQIEAIVAFCVKSPDTLVQDVGQSLPSSLLSLANPEPQNFVYNQGLNSTVEKHAIHNPDKLALCFATDIDEAQVTTQELTYEELNTKANKLAHFLVSIGTRPDELVCICMEKSIDLYIGILAIVKAGAGYLPLVPEIPSARLGRILSDAKVKTALTDGQVSPIINDIGSCKAYEIASIDLSTFPTTNPDILADPSNIAYAVFTSGTTGQPKGVLVTQENILSNLTVLEKIYPVGEDSRLLQACSQAFDVSVFEIFFSWFTGMCLCSATKDVLFRDISNAINQLEVTHLSLTPTVASLVDPQSVPKVEFLVTAGEAVTTQVHRAWAGKGLYNGYGPSETTNILSVNPKVRECHPLNNVGQPFENSSAFVLSQDSGFSPLPTGALGELCFGGQQVFRGYQAMEELTNSKIVDHPTYGRVYRSGDLGRMLPDGTLLIEGRVDDQRKLRGQRIELGEISSTLLRAPFVQDCSVQIIGETKELERLVVFWIPSERASQEYALLDPVEDLSSHIIQLFQLLGDELPMYMIPSLLVPLTALPMTSQGKIDRRCLRNDLENLSPEALTGYSLATEEDSSVEPQTDTERNLTVALAEALQIPQLTVSRNTSFFALGLDSISAIRYAKAVRSLLGVSLDVSTILRRSSVARLATAIESSSSLPATSMGNHSTSARASTVGTSLGSHVIENFGAHNKTVVSVLPCTPLQEAMLAESSAGSNTAYFNRTLFKLSCDVSRLRKAWEEMVKRHDILRTAFAESDDARYPYLQVVLSEIEMPWQQMGTWTESPRSLLEPHMEQDMKLVLGFEPPYAMKVYESSSAVYLLLDMHHALYDGNAMSNLLLEVERSYHGVALPAPARFEAFLDHIVSLDMDAAEAFFAAQLDQYIPHPFPRRDGPEAKARYGVTTTQLPCKLSIVQSFLRKHNVTMIGLVQAAWVKVLSTAQNQDDLCFGSVLSGRSAPVEGVLSLVAPCFNTVPVRVNVAKSRTNLALIKTLQKINVDLLPHQMTPLRRIQAKMSLGGQRLFDSLILLQQSEAARDTTVWQLEGESGDMGFPCIVEVLPQGDTVTVSLHYDRHYIDNESSINALRSAYMAAFGSCVDYPSGDALDLIGFDKALLSGMLRSNPESLANLESQSTESSTIGNSHEDWSSTELEIRKVFAAVSGMPEDRISRDTTIYRIGLDSISAIRVSNHLRKRGFHLTAGHVLENPSCSQLASAVQSQGTSPSQTTPACDFQAFDRRFRASIKSSNEVLRTKQFTIRPCTAVQAGMISQYLQSEIQQYFNHTFYLLDTDATKSQVAQAWGQVMARHEMLRTGFVGIEDTLHPFAMLTYQDWNPQSTELRSKITNGAILSFAERERAAAKSVRKDLHYPPWCWDLFSYDGRPCLQFSAHHALFDAETLRFIQNDLRLALEGHAVPTRGSIDSALTSIITSSTNKQLEQAAFWSNHLKDAPVSRFPNLCPVRVSEGSISEIETICRVSQSAMEDRCRTMSTTLQAAGQAAWARLLAAYSGESRICFGVVLSGRNTAETMACPFPCITTLPITADTSLANDELLPELLSSLTAIRKYQFTPLTDIQRYAGRPSEALFDSLFAYQKPLIEDSPDSSWDIAHTSASVDYSISIEMEVLPRDQLRFRLTVNTAHIPSPQGRIMLGQFESLLMSILGESHRDGLSLSVVPPKHPVLPTDIRFLHEFVAATVSACPDRIAMEFVRNLVDGQVSSKSWTYRDLDEESNRVAQFLVQRGVQSNSVVAASFDKCPEASFVFLGILKAGCAFCAIDPTAPVARKQFILEDSNAKLLFTSANTVKELEGTSSCEIVNAIDNEELQCMPVEAVPEPRLTHSSISYVLYTSGTTGLPKGCELTHDNAVQGLLAFQEIFSGRWTKDSRWLQFASYHFDVAVLEQFWTWSVGIRLVCAPRDLILEDLAGFIDTLQISHLDLTPSLGRLLDPTLVPSLHQGVFITGGEAVKQDMIESWGDFGCLFNFYGPTECTIGVTTFPCVPCEGKPSNIGWQFPNVGTFVLAPGTKTPVMRGGIGELCISGKLVGKGYLNRPELTEDRFPNLDGYNERIYRTGDLVRLLHDDSIEFLGRQDSQVKLRGQRLEIDEIESVIRTCPDIQDVVCLVAKHPKQDKDLLVGFIGLSPKRKQFPPTPASVESSQSIIAAARAACEERLPGYMVPTHFIPIEHIPLSINNKVEEKQLRQLYRELPNSTVQQYSAQSQDQKPLNSTEQSIARILASLLKINESELSGSSNVFALGLSSITAIQFVRRLKAGGFPRAQVTMVMQNATISGLAKTISTDTQHDNRGIIAAKQSISACRQRYRGFASQILGSDPDDIEDIAACTPLQQGLISRSMNADSLLYFNALRYELQSVNVEQLKDSFQQAVKQTQILRTAFIETDDGYVQVVKNSTLLTWYEILDVTEGALEDRLKKRKEEWRSRNDPHLLSPFEVVVAQSHDRIVLVVHIHHALYDGNSIDILLDNITGLYRDHGANFGRPFIEVLPFGPLRQVEGVKDFWLEYLDDLHKEPMTSLDQAGSHDILQSVNSDLLVGADQIRKSLNVTLQAIVQAAWSATLRKYYQGGIGAVVSGRSLDFDGVESVLGPLFNTIPFNPVVGKDDSWSDLVQRCHSFNVSALPFQHTPIRDITKWLKGGPSEPLFDTLFVFQSGIQDHGSAQQPMFILQDDTQFEADYPLSFEAQETSEGVLTLTIAAKGSICSRPRAAQLLEEFEGALSAIISDPHANIGLSLQHDFQVTKHRSISRSIGKDLNATQDFSWSPQALVLRSEIASLASLDESDIDEHVSIFELGLDSVDAVKLSSRLKKKGLVVAVSALMRLQTIPKIIDSFKKSATSQKREASHGFITELEPLLTEYAGRSTSGSSLIERVLPASPMQEALVSEMIKSGHNAYFNHDVLKISESIDIADLARAWTDVVHSSPILRTGFLEIDDPDLDVTFAQIISKPQTLIINNVDLDTDDFAPLLKSVQHEFQSRSLTEPQFQLTWVTTKSGRYLVLSIAHALYDGYSLSLIHEDVGEAYHGRYKPRPSYLEVLEGTLSASQEGATTFWRGLLSGANKTNVVSKEELHGSSTTFRREKRSKVASSDVTKFCKNEGITTQALCQTAWAFVLAHLVRDMDVMYGVVLAGRDTALAQLVTYPTMNTVVMRSILHGSRRDMLKYMQGTIADLTEHQHSPLRQIQAAYRRTMPTDGSQTVDSLFNTLFTFQRRPESSATSSPALYHSVNGASDVEYPIAVEAEVLEEGLFWRTACKSTVFSEDETENMLEQLDLVMSEIMARPENPSFEVKAQEIGICSLPPFRDTSFGSVADSQPLQDVSPTPHSPEQWSLEEDTIRSVIAQVSKTPTEEISKQTPIQNLGVDSINAIKISALLRKKSLKISVGDIIRAGSIANMAATLQARNSGSQPLPVASSSDQVSTDICLKRNLIPERFGLNRQDVESFLPATSGQVYMLSAWQRTMGQVFYPEFEYVLAGDISHNDIRAAWTSLVEHHAVLRSVFYATKDEEIPFIQAIMRSVKDSYMDLDTGDDSTSTTLTQPYAHLRVKSLPDGFGLGLKIHHALYDAVSLPLLLAELEQRLRSQNPQPPSIVAQPSFSDFITLSSGHEVKKSQEEFWTDYLRGTSALPLARTSLDSSSRRIETFDPSVVPMNERHEAVLRKQGINIQALFFAAYAQAYVGIARHEAAPETNEDVVIGIYMANRSHLDDLSAVAAPTVNLVPLRVRSPHKQSLVDVAKQIQSYLQAIGTVANSTASLWEIEKWTGVKVDTFVNFIKIPERDDDAEDAQQKPESSSVAIGEAQDGRTTAKRSQVHESSAADFKLPTELQKNIVKDAYLPSLDIEATVSNGALGIGVFGWEQMMGLERAERLIEQIAEALTSVVNVVE
ncbi:hypothetical protein AAFC00_001462 [Neodothiora populina]|uniref:Carrier domain-containing protein n=1 Tax=Neodothiora populina TaxID=2781224 RepID=A0ABR3PQ13_9PEZI